MSAREALLWLITTEAEWLEAFRLVCSHSPFHLRSQVWQFQEELKNRGHEFEHDDLEDALFELARALLPESPAARWDSEWAGDLASHELRYLAERYVEGADLSVLEPWAEKLYAAGVAEDRRAFRAAMRGYVRAGLAAIEAARRGAA